MKASRWPWVQWKYGRNAEQFWTTHSLRTRASPVLSALCLGGRMDPCLRLCGEPTVEEPTCTSTELCSWSPGRRAHGEPTITMSACPELICWFRGLRVHGELAVQGHDWPSTKLGCLFQDQSHMVKPLSKCLLGLEQSSVDGDMETSMSRVTW